MSVPPASRAIVDLAAYMHNLGVVRRFVGPQAGIVAVIKANAYGHGAVALGQAALEAGAAMLGVATIEEGMVLRQAGMDTPVMVIVQPPPDALEAALEHNLTLLLSDAGTAQRLGAIAQRMRRVAAIHCKVDTGMGRQGFDLDTAAAEMQHIARISNIDIVGVATHFPAAERVDDNFTFNQIKAFRQLLKSLDKQGVPYETAHAANSAAIVNYQGSIFDMVRPGLITYGVWPAEKAPEKPLIRPVMRWESTVVQVRELKAGVSIGYGRTYTTPRHTRTAIVPVGYADGYKHALSNRGDVLIRGRRCRVRGSVCMDQIVVDVTGLPEVRPGDPVTLIGRDGADSISVEELAQRAGTISYDILTGIGDRVRREYLPAQ